MPSKSIPLLLTILLLGLALMPVALAGNHENALEKRVIVGNRPPSTGPPDLSDNDDEPGQAGVRVQPSAGAKRTLGLSATVQDHNGHNDIQSFTVTVYKPDNTTVHVEPLAGTKASGTGRQAVFEAQFDMDFHDAPGTYLVKIEVTDRNGQTSVSWGEFIFEELAGVAMEETSVSLNPGGDSQIPIMPGNDTRDNPSVIIIANSGNVPIDAQLSGTDMTNGDESAAIGVDNIVYSTTSNFDPETALSGETATLSLALTPGASSSASIYFAVDIPTGLPADTYQGTMTLSAVKTI